MSSKSKLEKSKARAKHTKITDNQLIVLFKFIEYYWVTRYFFNKFLEHYTAKIVEREREIKNAADNNNKQ